jgi:flagellin
MALSIVSNQAASIATRSLGQSNEAATATAEKLSSGKRINSAADDAAGSAIAARLSAEVAGLQQAGVNAGQASSLLQIADGAFQNVEDILTRAKSLSVQAGSDQISDQERAFLDQEFQALKGEIDRIAGDTEFNGSKLVNGDIDVDINSNVNGASRITGIATTGGGTGAINTAGGSASFNSDLADMSGFQGINFNGVQLGESMTVTQTDGGAMVADFIRTGAANLNVMATGTTGGVGTTGMAVLTFNATAGVMTTGGGTSARMFTFMQTLTTGTGMTATAMIGSNATFELAVAAGGGAMGTLDVMGPVTLTAQPPAGSDSFAGSVTIMLTGNYGTQMTNAASGATETNGNNQAVLFNGRENTDFTFKVGTGVTEAEDEISVSIGGITTRALELDGVDISSKDNADSASIAVSDAINSLQEKRSEVGAAQNRLDFASQNVELTRENQEAARSELEDLNVAKAITEFSQQQLLVQAGTSTLSQANSLPQNLLQLFR